jgi:hypothetical protein
MSNQTLPPGLLLRSFLTVASGYVLCIISMSSIMVTLGYLGFPSFIEFLDLDIETQQTIMETNPDTAIPPTMFWLTVGLSSIACMAIGWLVVKTAPFAPFPHAAFLAVLLFIYFLQTALADNGPKKSMTLVYMLAFPLAIFIGARLAGRTIEEPGLDALDDNS